MITAEAKAVKARKKLTKEVMAELGFENRIVSQHDAFARYHEAASKGAITQTRADTQGWGVVDTHTITQRLRNMPVPFTRFGHGAVGTQVKAAARARELLGPALEGMEKDKEKLAQETEEVQMGLVDLPPSFFGDFPT